MTDLDELERLHKAATQGEWRTDRDGRCSLWIRHDTDRDANIPICHFGANRPDDTQDRDARAIVAAHNALPALIAELRAAREMREAYRALANCEHEKAVAYDATIESDCDAYERERYRKACDAVVAAEQRVNAAHFAFDTACGKAGAR